MRTSRLITLAGEETDFPDPSQARADGLVAVGGELSVDWVLRAYRKGIFPWSANPVTWWSPDPRGVIPLESFHVPRRLERVRRQGKFTVTFDRAFPEVMQGCAAPARGREDTWISRPFLRTYGKLFRLGIAHSVEVWEGPRLVGGLYGVAIGGFFAGESMFHYASNASSVALVHTLEHLRNRGFSLFDTQMVTPHTERFGAVEIPRKDYLEKLRGALALPVVFGDPSAG
jgi:leucyl/phenylalanyl-tRNA--protein transferase